MKKFRTTLFNGYQKNAVDDYLEDLMREHRLSARYIVSQMIIQGADFIEIREEP